jgi:hypothetical protein
MIEKLIKQLKEDISRLETKLTINDDNINFVHQDLEIIFTLTEGNYFNNIYDLNIEGHFKLNEELNLLEKEKIIPIKRAKSLFEFKPFAQLELTLLNNDNFKYKISLEKDKINQQSSLQTITLLKYTSEFILLHNRFLNKKKELTERWNENDISQTFEKEKYNKDDITIQVIKFNDSLYFITDYNYPKGLKIPKIDYLFPEGRLHSFLKQYFPTPNIYRTGNLEKTLPKIEIDNQKEDTNRIIYKFDLNDYFNTSREKIFIDVTKDYIIDFIKLHKKYYEKVK